MVITTPILKIQLTNAVRNAEFHSISANNLDLTLNTAGGYVSEMEEEPTIINNRRYFTEKQIEIIRLIKYLIVSSFFYFKS